MSRRTLFGLSSLVWKLLLAATVVFMLLWNRAGAQTCVYNSLVAPGAYASDEPETESWIFRRSRYTHDPETGARVAQYALKPPIEPLDDPRLVTTGYTRTRTVLRGPDGSADTYYRVQSYGNGRGGLDAEWERFHDAWRGSTIGGGYSQIYPSYGYGGYGYGGGYGPSNGGPGDAGPGWGGPGWGGWRGPGWGAPGFRGNGPGYGYGPGFGVPDAGRLDPDGADGYDEPRRRTPDRDFFNGALPGRERPNSHHD